MYYVIEYASFQGEAGLLPGASGHDNSCFDDGALVTGPSTTLTFVMTAEKKGNLGDFVLTASHGLLISARFRKALEQAGVDNVQYFAAVIQDQTTGRDYTDYFLGNVLGLVDCIDMSRTKLEMRAIPDSIRFIHELHIDESRARDLLLFRLARRRTMVLVAERVKQVLEAARLVGLALVPAEGYSD